MPEYTQELHRISVKTPLGKDRVYLKSFHGQEEFSRLFKYTLELLSDDDWIDYQIENDPRFLKRIQQARESLRKGKGVKLENVAKAKRRRSKL